ncbi:MAG: hypothetical protein MRJ65_10330 [Candidatus Brocadiaceae bacterium]|nr:hypothetical protein [Candidatus Brocadiaceae bacterium]
MKRILLGNPVTGKIRKEEVSVVSELLCKTNGHHTMTPNSITKDTICDSVIETKS